MSAIIYVINISEDMERLKESRECLHKLLYEPIIQGGECNILAVVYNNKPNLTVEEPNNPLVGDKKSKNKQDETSVQE